MRICIVHEAAYPFTFGGGQRRLYEIGRRLVHIGWHVDWLTFQSWKGSSTLTHDGINYIGLQSAPRFFNRSGNRSMIQPLIFFFCIFQHLKLLRNYDVLWTGQWPLLHLLPITIISRLFKFHLVVDWWEVWGWQVWLNHSRSIGWLGYLLEQVLIRFVAKNGVLITDCKSEAHRLQKILSGNSIVHYIPNGIPRTEIGNVDLNQVPEFDIVSLGRLKNHKRVDLLLEGLWCLREYHGITATTAIIGDGPERDILHQLALNLELEDQVRFFGFIPDPSEVYAILKKSRLFVLTTINGGGGNLTLLEAYGCGLPVIAFKVKEGIDHELIDQGKSGLLVEPVNSRVLAASLATLLQKDDYITEMKKYTLSKSKDYEWDMAFKDYLKIFKVTDKVSII